MISKNQYDDGIRCKGMCDFGDSNMGKGLIGGGCAERGFCYQYKMQNKSDNNILWKKITFKEREYMCKVDLYNLKLFVYNMNGDELYSNPLYTNNLVKECKDAVLKANAIVVESQIYEDFMRWDGNMDE